MQFIQPIQAPFLSIIIATFNAGRTLEQTIQSIICQSFSDYELIIVDGGSKDETMTIIDKHKSKISYRTSEPDKGIYDAWNKGLKMAVGEWITFIGADDFLYNENVLFDIIPYLNKAKIENIRYVYGKAMKIDPDTNKVKIVAGKEWKRYKDKIKQNMCMPHWATFHHREMFRDNGVFDASYKISGDYEFLLREFVQDRGALFADINTVVVRDGGVSGNRKLLLQMALEQKSARKQNKICSFSFKLYIWIAQIKTLIFLNKYFGDTMSGNIHKLYLLLHPKRNV